MVTATYMQLVANMLYRLFNIALRPIQENFWLQVGKVTNLDHEY